MSDIEVVREVVIQGETRLVDVTGRTTALRGKHMVLWKPGHFSAIARNRDVSSRYKSFMFVQSSLISLLVTFSPISLRAVLECTALTSLLLSSLDRRAKTIGTSAKCTTC